jgi:hypothetical protein
MYLRKCVIILELNIVQPRIVIIKVNSIMTRIHQVMANMLRAFAPEERYLDPEDSWNEFLQACALSINSMYHTTLQATPLQDNYLVRLYGSRCKVFSKLGHDIIKTNMKQFIEKSNKSRVLYPCDKYTYI